MNQRRLSIVLATVAISAAFIGLIWPFLIALFLAGLFSAMSAPLYQRVLSFTGGRNAIATALTLIILYAGVLAPLLGVVYIAALQASDLTTSIVAFVDNMETVDGGLRLPDWLPYRNEIEAAGEQTMAKLGELVGSLAGYLVQAASAATRGTASFFLSLFIMTYAMAFFLREKTDVFTQLLRYSGLPPQAQERLGATTVSVSRATIRGTLLLGLIQGVLGGLGFFIAGIEGAAFWGILMAIASVIPGIGPALVWVPGVIFLLAQGELTTAAILAAWSFFVVSTIDNVLRPSLVGRDTQMPDVLVLISTLGGLAMFGAVGLIIGPVIAGLFIAIWELADETFGFTSTEA